MLNEVLISQFHIELIIFKANLKFPLPRCVSVFRLPNYYWQISNFQLYIGTIRKRVAYEPKTYQYLALRTEYRTNKCGEQKRCAALGV